MTEAAEQTDWGIAGKPAQAIRTITIAMTDAMRFSPEAFVQEGDRCASSSRTRAHAARNGDRHPRRAGDARRHDGQIPAWCTTSLHGARRSGKTGEIVCISTASQL